MSSAFASRRLDKFVIRLPEGMRDKIDLAARANKRSMNAEIVQRLETSFSSSDEPPPVVNKKTAESDMILELMSFREEFAEFRETILVPDFTDNGTTIRETRQMVGELLEHFRTLTKSRSAGDQSKQA
jgi:Arc-like DNA binding dprotein